MPLIRASASNPLPTDRNIYSRRDAGRKRWPDSGLSEMKSSPRLRPLHGDPRWAAFMMKMGFDD
jgi:hypothetical protein